MGAVKNITEAQIRELVAQGKQQNEMAEILGISEPAVSWWMRRLGIKLKKVSTMGTKDAVPLGDISQFVIELMGLEGWEDAISKLEEYLTKLKKEYGPK